MYLFVCCRQLGHHAGRPEAGAGAGVAADPALPGGAVGRAAQGVVPQVAAGRHPRVQYQELHHRLERRHGAIVSTDLVDFTGGGAWWRGGGGSRGDEDA